MQVSWRFTVDAPDSTRLRTLILETLNYCISIRLPSGNFPSSEKDDDDDPSDRLVQWCHGAVGLSLACIKAVEVFGRHEYIQPACELGDVVWMRGLLKKGLGLCHGIGGNAYVFLRLYELTHDSRHLIRACRFAQFALTSSHSADLLSQPDEPSSLGNGRAGFLCFGMDLLVKLIEHQEKHAATSESSASSSSSAASSTSSSSSSHPISVSSNACFPGFDLLL